MVTVTRKRKEKTAETANCSTGNWGCLSTALCLVMASAENNIPVQLFIKWISALKKIVWLSLNVRQYLVWI